MRGSAVMGGSMALSGPAREPPVGLDFLAVQVEPFSHEPSARSGSEPDHRAVADRRMTASRPYCAWMWGRRRVAEVHVRSRSRRTG